MYAKAYGGLGSSGSYLPGENKSFMPWAPWDDVKNGNYQPIKVRIHP